MYQDEIRLADYPNDSTHQAIVELLDLQFYQYVYDCVTI